MGHCIPHSGFCCRHRQCSRHVHIHSYCLYWPS
ncbi:MAG: hypothetical protein ACHQRM_10820 [Bacteroidia bacterium]